MDRLRRFDVAEHADHLMVVIESDLLPPDPAVVVVPLIVVYPAVTLLNPAIRHDGRPLILATRRCAGRPFAGSAMSGIRAMRSPAPSTS